MPKIPGKVASPLPSYRELLSSFSLSTQQGIMFQYRTSALRMIQYLVLVSEIQTTISYSYTVLKYCILTVLQLVVQVCRHSGNTQCRNFSHVDSWSRWAVAGDIIKLGDTRSPQSTLGHHILPFRPSPPIFIFGHNYVILFDFVIVKAQH